LSGVKNRNTSIINCFCLLLIGFEVPYTGVSADFKMGMLHEQELDRSENFLAKRVTAKKSKPVKRVRRVSRKKRRKKFKRRRAARCPRDMVFVYSKRRRVKVCVDKYELSYPGKRPVTRVRPIGYRSQISCMHHCRKRGKRLLNNREWLVACEGTRPGFCNIYRSHPVINKVRSKKSWIYKGVNCKKGKMRWSKHCMRDPSLNRTPKGLAANKGFSKCVSKYGVYNMVGNLGEWVAGAWRNKNGKLVARFNGGLYPQNKSSCSYSTVAHGPGYSDYSIGCRCGKNPYY